MWGSIRNFENFDFIRQPTDLLLDLEIAASNAATGTFGGAHASRRYFHLGQAVDRKVVALGIRGKYRVDDSFRLRAKSLPALAFLPPDRVVEAYNELQQSFPDCENDLLSHFEDNYIGRLTPGGRRSPRFSIESRNVRERALRGYTRTYNAVAGFHDAFSNYVLQSARPSFWNLIDSL